MASVDLRDAYYIIPVHEEDQKFFSFAWGGGGGGRIIKKICTMESN